MLAGWCVIETRPHCWRCDKPQSMCLCGYLTPIPNTVGVHVLQHPRERHHPLGTARLLRLGLAKVQVHVLDLKGKGKGASSVPVALPEGAGLIYPSEDALDLVSLPVAERPAHLVAIDGTWSHANRIFKDNPWISSLPRYRLTTVEGSRYRIRTEPRLECLSTVESVVAALRCLQPDLRGTETLEAAFDAMIDAQIAASATPSAPRRRQRVRQRPPRHIPAALLREDAKIVVVYAEAAPLLEGDLPRAPIRLSAVTLDGARTFDRLIQTEATVDAYVTELMGLDASELEPAQPYPEVLSAFRVFSEHESREGSLVFVCWGNWTHRWLTEKLDETPRVLLKGVWANISKARIPALDVLLERLELDIPDLPVTGRAGQRLA
ncbi:MAG: DTW domain-containing protein YfiP, partial [Myxococcota bacterium]